MKTNSAPNRPPGAALALFGLGCAAGLLGLTGVAAAGTWTNLVGVPVSPAGRWWIRIFGVRELCLALALGRAAASADGQLATTALDMVMLAQIGDIPITSVMAIRGHLPRRLLVGVWATSLPSLLIAVSARQAYAAARRPRINGRVRAPEDRPR